MGNVKQNAYHVKLKLIPTNPQHKSQFAQGIVFEMTPSKAEALAIKNITDALKNEKVDVKAHSTVKLRKDFIFHT